jgi:mRNA interferase MazF
LSVRRGQLWWARLDPTVGSEQSGRRPVLVLQNNAINAFTTTALTLPLTTNLRRAQLPSCVLLPRGSGGLIADSIVLCHQLRVLDTSRLTELIGTLEPHLVLQVENALLFTLGIGWDGHEESTA